MKKIIILILLLTINVYAEEYPVEFKKCVDGDTLQVIYKGEKVRVRLLAIDTPESVEDNGIIEPFGKEASNYTCSLLKNAEKITMEFDPKSDEKDKYERYLAYVYVDGEMLQKKLLSKGYAKVAYVYDEYLYLDELKQVEEEAKRQKIGIWSEEEYQNNIEEVVEENFFDKIWHFLQKIFVKLINSLDSVI